MGKYLGVSNESMKILSVVGTNQYNISYNNEVYIYSGVHWYLYVANGSVRIDNAFYVKDLK